MLNDMLVVPKALLGIMLRVVEDSSEISYEEQVRILKNCLEDLIENSDTLEDWKKQWTAG